MILLIIFLVPIYISSFKSKETTFFEPNESKEKKPNPIIDNKPQINNIFLSPESHINCIFQYENIKIIG